MQKLLPWILLAALLAGAAIAIGAADKQFSGLVLKVHDGDGTITVRQETRSEKVRLAGVDSPELGQPFGAEAKQFTTRKCLRKTVRVKWSKRDRYQRLLGELWVPGQVRWINVNRELVRNGLAWVYMSTDAKLLRLEQEARRDKIGLWGADTKPIPPSEWRKGKRE